MDRFNSNEERDASFKSKASDIAYSCITIQNRVDMIVKAQEEAYIEGQQKMINDLVETMEGVPFIDREFIEIWISTVKK